MEWCAFVERPGDDGREVISGRAQRLPLEKQPKHVVEVPGRDLLDERYAERQVVQLGQSNVPAFLAVLLDLIPHTTKIRRQATSHIRLDPISVALELVNDQLRHEEGHPAFVDQHSDGDDELLPVYVLGRSSQMFVSAST